MTRDDIKILDLVLTALYQSATPVKIKPDVLIANGYNLDINQFIRVKRMLEISGLAEKVFLNNRDDWYKITQHGFEIATIYGQYSIYLKEIRIKHRSEQLMYRLTPIIAITSFILGAIGTEIVEYLKKIIFALLK